MELEQLIVDATQDVFDTMLFMEVANQSPFPVLVNNFNYFVSGMIGLAGQCRGLLAIHAHEDVAMAITSRFLGVPVDVVAEEVVDAFGELANMLAGNIKMALDPSGKAVTLSVPSCIHGADYHVECVEEAFWVVVPFDSDDGEFTVELQIGKA